MKRSRLLTTAGPILAISCCWAAHWDQENGFSFAAAMEWRKAADLCASIPALADRCWRKWEAIMHLPRCLAVPLGGNQGVPLAMPQPCKVANLTFIKDVTPEHGLYEPMLEVVSIQSSVVRVLA